MGKNILASAKVWVPAQGYLAEDRADLLGRAEEPLGLADRNGQNFICYF